MIGRGAGLLGALLGLAAAGCGGGDGGGGGGVTVGGPLQRPVDFGATGTTLGLRSGQELSEALIGITNAGREVAVLESARAVGVRGPLPRLTFYAAGPGRERTGAGGATKRFPPEFYAEAIKPLRGHRLPARGRPGGREGLFLVARGRHGAAPEPWSLGGYEVGYRVGERRYRAVFPHVLLGCPRSCADVEPPNPVPFPEGA